ncbi:MAG TPA: AAA family ATPase [Acidimicrobiales bacterium]|nr:AAA family ATPase [Acidimicrobiales bacterium]
MTRRGTGSGLAWPDHDSGPTPPPHYSERARGEEAGKRHRMALWDRIKLIVLLLGAWVILVWSTMERTPIEPLRDAVRDQLRSSWWLLGLASLEALRQVHYLMSESSASWHRFWSQRVFGGANRRIGHMKDWTRYRFGRVLRILLVLAVLSFVLGRFYHVSPAVALFKLPAAVFKAMPMVLQLGFAFFFIIFQFVGLFWFLSRGGTDVYMPGDIKTRFADVWGQDAVLERVKENIIFLRRPEAIEEKGGYVPGGILLWGPPGTGKTLMAEAVAGETNNPFVFVDPGAFTNMFMGVGILKVKSLFRKLRKLALRYGGVVVFFDEADALGNRGAMMPAGPWGGGMGFDGGHGAWATTPECNGLSWLEPSTSAMLLRSALPSRAEGVTPPGWRQRFVAGMGMGGGGMGTLQALLTELSGMKKPRGFWNRTVRRSLGLQPKPPPKYRMLVMMATNMPQALDEALLRPGRIDRIYKVGYPSKAGRIRTYDGYLEKVSHSLSLEEVDRLATITPYATGATIKDLVNEALINAIRDGRATIEWRDIVKAKHLKDLGPPEDVEYIQRERHAVAVHEACHAVAAVRVRHHLTIDVATIEKGGTYLGMVASIPPEDQFTRWRSEYEADIMVSLASLAGERLFFDGDNSSGVSGDLEGATQIATLMEGYWGMGQTVASHGVTHKVGIGGGGGRPGKEEGKRDKDLLESSLGERIEEQLAGLLERTRELLGGERLEVLAVAHALESHKTLTGEDVVAIVQGRQGPLVDGRPYHLPEFVQELEAYHSLAMAAHRSHGGSDLTMPVVPVLPPADAGELAEIDEIPESEPLPAASWGFHQDTSAEPDEER